DPRHRGGAGRPAAAGRQGAPALLRAGRRQQPYAGRDRPDDGRYPRADPPAPGPGAPPAPRRRDRGSAAGSRGLILRPLIIRTASSESWGPFRFARIASRSNLARTVPRAGTGEGPAAGSPRAGSTPAPLPS